MLILPALRPPQGREALCNAQRKLITRVCTVSEMNSLSRLKQWLGSLSPIWQVVLFVAPFLAVRLALPILFPGDSLSLVSIFIVYIILVKVAYLGLIAISYWIERLDGPPY